MLAFVAGLGVLLARRRGRRGDRGTHDHRRRRSQIAGDITIVNERLAFALAVGSPAPYGVPRGAIIDVAPVTGGRIGQDCVVFADFIPNNWSAWPNTFQRIDILERGPKRAVVRTVRDWGKATVTSVYTLESNSRRGRNKNDPAQRRRYGASRPAVGFDAVAETRVFLRPSGTRRYRAGAERRGGRGSRGCLRRGLLRGPARALCRPYRRRSMDMYRLHSLAPGESREFDAWLQVGRAEI